MNGAWTATAINRGSIATTGDAFYFQEDEYRSDGLVAVTQGGLARAVNEAGGEIRTGGALAYGVRAQDQGDDAGRAEGTNRGAIATTGAGSYGMRVWSISGDAAGTNAGTIATSGGHTIDPRGFTRYAPGLWVSSISGTAAATNEVGGEIRTAGVLTAGMGAQSDRADGGRSEGTNRGAIATTGAGSDGILIRSRSGAATAVNAGRIITRGGVHEDADGDKFRADGIFVTSTSGNAAATNEAGGVIETHGALGRGMRAASRGSGVATASNAGRIVTHSADSLARSEFDPDVRSGWADDRIGATGIVVRSASGDAAVTHTGSVAVAGDSTGIYAGTFGTGTTAGVTMAGGRVEAGDDGAGVWIEAPESTAEAAFSDGAYVDAGTALLVRSCFSDVTVEDSEIRGELRFSSGCGAGTQRLTIGDGASIIGEIVFDEDPPPPGEDPPPPGEDPPPPGEDPPPGDPVCSLPIAELVAIVRASVHPWDELCIDVSGGTIRIPNLLSRLGVSVPSGVSVPLSGSVLSAALVAPAQTGRRIVAVRKMGAGTARLSDATLPDSSIVLKEGGLELRGHVDLGVGGTVTVHDATRLAFLVGDVTENPDDHGSLAAGGGVIFQQQEEAGEPTIGILVAPEAAGKEPQIRAALEGGTVQPLRGDTRILKRVGDSEPTATTAKATTTTRDGETYEIGAFSEPGTVSIDVPEGRRIGIAEEIEEAEPEAVASRRSDGPEVAAGAAALLAFIFGSGLFDDAGTGEAALDECADTRRGWCTSVSLAGPGSPATVEERARLGGLETWTRLVGTDTAVPAAGVAGAAAESLSLGMDARLAGGFRLGVAVTPEMTSSKPWAPGVASGATLQGNRFALRAGWRDGPLFADAELSQGRYDARAVLDNPAVGGALAGTLDLVQRQARATAGARIDLGGVRLTPALSPFSGTLRQDAWTAESAALTADVPGVSRRYSGVKASLGATSSEWLPGPGDLRWRPSLRFSTMSVDTEGPSSLAMRQSDKAGVLSFASRGQMADLPRRVHGLATTVTAAGSGDWRLRLGYAGMEVDGDVEHGAGLRLQVRF